MSERHKSVREREREASEEDMKCEHERRKGRKMLSERVLEQLEDKRQTFWTTPVHTPIIFLPLVSLSAHPQT